MIYKTVGSRERIQNQGYDLFVTTTCPLLMTLMIFCLPFYCYPRLYLALSSPVSSIAKLYFNIEVVRERGGGQDVRVTIAESLICFALLVLICFKTEPYRFIPT